MVATQLALVVAKQLALVVVAVDVAEIAVVIARAHVKDDVA